MGVRLLCASVWLACGACGGEFGGGGPDAAALDATDPDAAAPDAAVPGVPDAAVCELTSFGCTPTPVTDPALCAATVALEPDAPLTGQDTAIGGGYGECAVSASGLGGPSLYYRVEVPPGRVVRIEAVPSTPGADGLVRAFTSCTDAATFQSGRGGTSTQGKAAVCLPNPDAVSHMYVIAVSRYSGEFQCMPIAFDLSIDVRLLNDTCQEIE